MSKNIYRNWAIYKLHDACLIEFASKYLKGRLIDIGCGRKPYKDLLSKFVSEHIGVDHENATHGHDHVDLVGTAYSIPVPDNSYDSALSTAVLEHLEEPNSAIIEVHRVLKDDGCLVLSAPFIWHLHEAPRDFFRYSRFGLVHLLEKNGFEVLECKALAGFWVTFATIFAYYLSNFDKSLINKLRIIKIIALPIQVLGFYLDKLHRDDRWAWMHMVVARKKAQS